MEIATFWSSQTPYYHDTHHHEFINHWKLAIIAQAKRSWKGLGLVSDRKSNVSVSWNCGKVSVSSWTENQISRSRLHPWLAGLRYTWSGCLLYTAVSNDFCVGTGNQVWFRSSQWLLIQDNNHRMGSMLAINSLLILIKAVDGCIYECCSVLTVKLWNATWNRNRRRRHAGIKNIQIIWR